MHQQRKVGISMRRANVLDLHHLAVGLRHHLNPLLARLAG